MQLVALAAKKWACRVGRQYYSTRIIRWMPANLYVPILLRTLGTLQVAVYYYLCLHPSEVSML